MDVSYGKKVKDTSSRGKTSKEEWKEREASANQAVPTRVKIFEGGSVERLTIRAHLLLHAAAKPASALHVWLYVLYIEHSVMLSGISPTKIMCTSEVEAGGNTFVKSAASAVRSPAC